MDILYKDTFRPTIIIYLSQKKVSNEICGEELSTFGMSDSLLQWAFRDAAYTFGPTAGGKITISQ